MKWFENLLFLKLVEWWLQFHTLSRVWLLNFSNHVPRHGCCTYSQRNGGVLAIGSMVMIYTFGHVSGAHFNPAVTVAIFARGNHNIEILDAIGYIMAQTVGGFLGAGIAKDALEHFGISNINYPLKQRRWRDIRLIVEILGIHSVVLNVATTKSQAHNSFFGGAIGLTVTAWAYVGGPISGGAFNSL